MSILMKETQKQKVSSSMKNKEHPSAKKNTYVNNNNSQGILNLHSSIGNQATQKLLNATGIQAKLTLSSPSDSYEREADRVADKVMSMNDSKVQTNSPITIQRKPESSNNTQELSSHTESKINSLHGRGEPLSSQTRSYFEPRFGKDFSKVRVHTDSSSNALASSINARAFTKGNHIVFNKGEYSPHSISGKRLLGHELTHTLQQRGSNINTISKKDEKKNEEKKENLKHNIIFDGMTMKLKQDPIFKLPELKLPAIDFTQKQKFNLKPSLITFPTDKKVIMIFKNIGNIVKYQITKDELNLAFPLGDRSMLKNLKLNINYKSAKTWGFTVTGNF